MPSNSPSSIALSRAPGAAANCAAIPVRSRGEFTIRRMQGLETAAKLLGGQRELGDAIGIETRSVRAKLNAERSITDSDLRLTIGALESRAKRMITHAEKLRSELGS